MEQYAARLLTYGVILFIALLFFILLKPSKRKNNFGGVTYTVNLGYVYHCEQGSLPVAYMIKQYPSHLLPAMDGIKIWYYKLEFDKNSKLKRAKICLRSLKGTQDCAKDYETRLSSFRLLDKTIEKNRDVPQLSAYKYVYKNNGYTYHITISKDADERKTTIMVNITV